MSHGRFFDQRSADRSVQSHKIFFCRFRILSELFIMDKSNAEVLEKIQMGYRMPRPQDCPEVREISKILFFNIF